MKSMTASVSALALSCSLATAQLSNLPGTENPSGTLPPPVTISPPSGTLPPPGGLVTPGGSFGPSVPNNLGIISPTTPGDISRAFGLGLATSPDDLARSYNPQD